MRGGCGIKAIPHNSKCRYGERGAAAAKPKAQIILCVLSSILATQMPCRTPSRSEALRSATAACGGSWRGDPPERCLSRKAGIMRCCLRTVSSRKREKPLRPRRLGQLSPQGRRPSDSDGRRGFFATRQRECFLLYSVSFPHASHAHTRPHRPNRPMPMPVSRSGRVSMPRAASNRVWGSSSPVQSRNAPVPAA